MKQLKEAIKNKVFKPCYLFTGEEAYLIELYVKQICKQVFEGQDPMINLAQYTYEQKNFDEVIGSLETLPFFAERRVVILWNMDLFHTKNKEKANRLVDTLEQIGETTLCILIEEKIDKRSRLYKKINKEGGFFEFKHLTEKELIQHVGRRLNKEGIKISTADAAFLIHRVGYELHTLEQEISKVIDYSIGQKVVTAHDIEQVTTKHIEAKIFELVDAAGNKQREKALALYQDMVYIKEPTTRILFMISRQMMLIHKVKLMQQGKKDQQHMASILKVPPFVARKLIEQSQRFSLEKLERMLAELLMLEYEFKQGKVELTMGIEVFILEQVC